MTNKAILEADSNSYIDILTTYYNEAYNHKILTNDEILELFKKYKNGDLKAREEIITHNLKLVEKVVRKYENKGLELIDLIQIGNIGLINAVDNFDINSNNHFSTYAHKCIENTIINGIYKYSRTIRLTNDLHRKLNEYYKGMSILRQKYSREATLEELSDYLNIPVKKVKILRSLTNNCIKFEELSEKDLNSVYSYSVENSAEDTFLDEYTKEEIVKLVLNSNLSAREKSILMYRYGLVTFEPLNLREIANIYNVTIERIRKIICVSLEKLATDSDISMFSSNSYEDEYINKIKNKYKSKRRKKYGNNKR